MEEAGPARVVRGTYEVPSYLTGDGGPGSNLANGEGTDDPLPERNGTVTANFVCTVPTAATGDDPARWVLFGHGLLGSADQTVDIGLLAANVNAGFCGTDWIGMSSGDLEFLASAIQELTLWRAVPDRLQQAHLNFLVLGRLLRADDGLVSDPAFQDATGAGVVDESQIFFVGGSQGGILGGATSAVATDWERAFLAVPGINYSLLLDRSDQFAPFEPVLADGYPDPVDRTVLLGVIQMLWDRGENNAYAQHLTRDPYDGTPRRRSCSSRRSATSRSPTCRRRCSPARSAPRSESPRWRRDGRLPSSRSGASTPCRSCPSTATPSWCGTTARPRRRSRTSRRRRAPTRTA